MKFTLSHTALLVIDIQENFIPHIPDFDQFLLKTEKLITACSLLEIPSVITEQNPSKLGKTISFIQDLLPQAKLFEKMQFSCFTNEYKEWLSNNQIEKIIICGIESHICVLQTALDLKEQSYIPIIISNTISSRKKEDYLISLERFKQESITVSTYESILFELLGSFDHPKAKEISKIIK